MGAGSSINSLTTLRPYIAAGVIGICPFFDKIYSSP